MTSALAGYHVLLIQQLYYIYYSPLCWQNSKHLGPQLLYGDLLLFKAPISSFHLFWQSKALRFITETHWRVLFPLPRKVFSVLLILFFVLQTISLHLLHTTLTTKFLNGELSFFAILSESVLFPQVIAYYTTTKYMCHQSVHIIGIGQVNLHTKMALFVGNLTVFFLQ